MSVERILELIFGQAGVIVVLLLILWSGWRGIWVWGSYAKELRERNERLEARLDRASRITEGATGLAARATRLVEEDRHTGAASE